MHRRAFGLALLLLPLGVLGNLAYMVLGTDRALLASLGTLPAGYLLAALGMALVPWFTATMRLHIWARFLGIPIPPRDLLRMALVVDLGSAVSPTSIGGEAFKWGLLVRHGVRPGTAASLALLPKLEDATFFALALPAAIVITRAWELPVVDIALGVLGGNVASAALTTGATLLVLVLLLRSAAAGMLGARVGRWTRRKWGRTRRRTRRTVHDARVVFRSIALRGKARFALALCFTACHWIARYGVISMLALFLGVPFDPVLFWLLQWVVFTIMSFVPTPGAAGGAEVAFTAVYSTLLPAGVIGIATAAWRAFTFYVPAGLAALLFAWLSRNEVADPPAAPLPPAAVGASVER